MNGWWAVGHRQERAKKKKEFYIIVILAASSGQSLVGEQSERFERWIFQCVRSPT